MIVKGKAFGTDFLGIFLTVVKGRLVYHSSFPKKEFLKQASEALGVEPWEINAETPLLGVFIGGNSREALTTLEIEGMHTLKTRYTAIGNLIVANDRGAIIAPVLEPLKGEIEEALGVKAEVMKVAGMEVVGSVVLANNKGAIVHPDASEEELDAIEKALKVSADYGTIAKSGFVGSMAVVSDNGALLPYGVLAPEIAILQEVLEIE